MRADETVGDRQSETAARSGVTIAPPGVVAAEREVEDPAEVVLRDASTRVGDRDDGAVTGDPTPCLLYTSPSPRD